jgi:hypothetical protein
VIVLAALLPIAAVGVLLWGSSAGARLNRPAPHVSLLALTPAKVSGHGFRAHQAVRVTLIATQKLVRRPVTNGSGAFTVSFPMAIDRCSGWSISASQAQGPTVTLHSPMTECAPA